jgi:hypothetical protein
MASCWWAVCWWGYGMGRHKLRTTNTISILSMAIWMHRDTVTRSWGPLSCHSTTASTSCFSVIMHSNMLQGSVHNSWKLNISQFFHGLHTHQTRHPFSVFGMLWIDVYDSVFQFPPISSTFTQPLKRRGTTFHRSQSTAWSTRCKGDALHEANGGHTRHGLVFWSTRLPFYYIF